MIHSIKIDNDIDEKLQEFNAKLPSDQRIVSIKPNEGYVFIQTEEKTALKDRNLLLEEFGRTLRDKSKRG